MEFISARELRLDPKGVWERIRADVTGVITINGKPSFLLTKLNPEELEEILYIQNRVRAELALNRMREQAAGKGLDRLEETGIEKIIRKTRQKKK